MPKVMHPLPINLNSIPYILYLVEISFLALKNINTKSISDHIKKKSTMIFIEL